MTEPENPVSRWSRLKRAAEKERKIQSTADAPSPHAVETGAPREIEAAAASLGADTMASRDFDLASLPPIDSITVGTEIRAFLQSGVPAALTQAALRRAWVSEPAIRDFIGIAENQWDFTDPTAIPGFGPLLETDDMPGLVAQALGTLGKASEASADMVAPAGEVLAMTDLREGAVVDRVRQPDGTLAASPVDAGMSAPAHETGKVGAAATDERTAAGNGPQRPRRPHGGALPQ